MINRCFAAAAVLSGLTALAHIALGGPELVPVLEASGLSAYEVTLSLMLFHITSLLLVVNTGFLGAAALGRELSGAVALVGVTYALIGVAFLWLGVSRLGNLWQMPQWLVLGLICIALWCGTSRRGAGRGGANRAANRVAGPGGRA